MDVGENQERVARQMGQRPVAPLVLLPAACQFPAQGEQSTRHPRRFGGGFRQGEERGFETLDARFEFIDPQLGRVA